MILNRLARYFTLSLLFPLTLGQVLSPPRKILPPKKSPLEIRIDHFDLTDAILRDGVSELSLKGIDGLHLGFEEVIRNKIQDDPRASSPHFSLHIENVTVKQVLDALCDSDARYTWARSGESVNIFPKTTVGDSSYLLNLRIGRIALVDVPDPEQALTPLSKLFPTQQVGYFGPGLADNTYPTPWSVTLDSLTVREFVNEIALHMGARTSWVWQGGKQERMFTFLKGGFHTSRPADPARPAELFQQLP